MKPALLLIVVVALACLLPLQSRAAVITVQQDGSGDYLTITDAIGAASANDTIEVGPGTYAESNDLYIPLTFVSTDGAASTIIDGSNTEHHLWFFNEPASSISGFKFVNGYNNSGGGSIRAQAGATIAIEDCIFENNHSDVHAGAIFVRDASSQVDVEACVLTGNTSGDNGGAATVILTGKLTFTNCVFDQNSTVSRGGAIATNNNSTLEITGCVFAQNTGPVGGALYIEDTFGFVTNNTFYANTSSTSGTIRSVSAGAGIDQNIFSDESAGYALYYSGAAAARNCNVFWNNADGPVFGDVLQANEIVADPLFCGAPTDLTISVNSPAAPANNLCAALVGAFPTNCGIAIIPEPTILSILDVGNDQGRQVRIIWERSVYDAPDDGVDITGYAVYRRQDAFLTATPVGLEAAAGSNVDPPSRSSVPAGWDYINTVPARGDALYQYVSPTLCDSTKLGGTCWSVFFVSALTPDVFTFFDSALDSGYSIDNIKPVSPNGFAVAYNGGSADLSWDPPQDPDFAAFLVYRGPTPNFVVSPQNLIHVTEEEQWTDDEGTQEDHYKVSATDDAGNESDPTSPSTLTGANGPQVPDRYALYQNQPNPFNPLTVVRYDVPKDGERVSIKVYDVEGRLVRTLVDGPQTAGERRVAWDGRDNRGQNVASGIYFYRLKSASYQRTNKMALLR